MTVTLERTSVKENLNRTIDLLKGHWCTGDLSKDNLDKFCAVGALAYVIEPEMVVELYSKVGDDGELLPMRVIDETAYEIVRESPEGRAVALEIVKSKYWPEYLKEVESGVYDDKDVYKTPEDYLDDAGEIDEIIYSFNDNAANAEEVTSMFRKAAESL